MAKINCRSSLAKCDDQKEPNALIDSDGTYHFFYSKCSFETYEKIPTETFRSAVGQSPIIGRGKFRLPIDGGITVEAFHTPLFSSNILSVGKLSYMYNITFSTEINNSETKSFCIFKRKVSTSVVVKQEMEDGLYAIKLPGIRKGKRNLRNIEAEEVACLQSTSSRHIKNASEWHKRPVHPSSERFIATMNQSP